MSDNEPRVWVNGRLTGVDEPSIAALDHGVTVGDGAFETAKIDRGQVFAATRHARRLDRTLSGLGLPAADHDYIAEGAKAVLEAGPQIEFGRLRYSVTGGAGPLGSDRDDSPLTYIVTAAAQPRPPQSASVAVVPWVRNERSAVAGLKTTSYAENVVALAYAKERGAIEAVFANTRGELCECTGSNIFVVSGGVLLTPPLESGCLAGITREVVVEWCREDGMDVREQTLPVEVLREADEVFITSSTKDVLGIHAVDDRALEVGPVTKRAAEVFARFSAERMDP
ncbi:aminotransferase class IV [Knoellia koreensis]|uniref:4-amino-4-deoxychorismate lyase n=1 Tax=Knoellia koreensis TaxID=2730921 RepID=A0A849HKB1_9MICO|nr:aminotransferase class IV [Knoellia sp. DB2414S]NNM45087.1 4-amino-4-deoxychorismate lyase [Knoellia sp. DB2414S]